MAYWLRVLFLDASLQALGRTNKATHGHAIANRTREKPSRQVAVFWTRMVAFHRAREIPQKGAAQKG